MMNTSKASPNWAYVPLNDSAFRGRVVLQRDEMVLTDSAPDSRSDSVSGLQELIDDMRSYETGATSYLFVARLDREIGGHGGVT